MASMSSSSGAVTSGILDGKVPVFVFPVQVKLSIAYLARPADIFVEVAGKSDIYSVTNTESR